jgi:hypothetical protein
MVPLNLEDDEAEGEALLVVDPEPEPVPVVLEVVGGAPAADEPLAAAWNASNDLFAVGLMAKTIPC